MVGESALVTFDYYPAWADIDLGAIAANIRALREHAPTAQVMAVVKADAYGHGLVPSAHAALAGGATWLGAAQVAEALALRRAGITTDQARILTWLYAPGAPLAELIEADIDISVAAPWSLAETIAAARFTGRVARVHLKVDTGLGRGGSMPADLRPLLIDALTAERDGVIRLVGLWSHMAFADEPGHPTVRHQAEVFDDALRLADSLGADLEVRHLANSAATLTDSRVHYDVVRPGLAVYGLSPVPQVGGPERFGLVPAMALRAHLANVKAVSAGQGVSYAHAYTTTAPTMLGLVPLGYADGIPRHASGGTQGLGGPMLVGEGETARILRIAGRVCMDQVVLDLGPRATEQPGDVVTLFGPAGDDPIDTPSAQDWAEAAGTISYEIVTRLGARVPRRYHGASQIGWRP